MGVRKWWLKMNGGNVAPIIIKKKKVVGGDGHHGGAWKVAYADFVTAMMAFFLLMWLLNATTEKQRKGIADYFNPTIAVNRVSGGGDGSLGGQSVFSENTLPRMGTGATSLNPTSSDAARGAINASAGDGGEKAQDAVAGLLGSGGESILEVNEQKHVELRLTDEGLVIEFFDIPDSPLFASDGTPNQIMQSLVRAVARTAQAVNNSLAIKAHVATPALVLKDRQTWELSSDRANTVRKLLAGTHKVDGRIKKVTALGDKDLAHSNPMSVRNNRIEIVFLRR